MVFQVEIVLGVGDENGVIGGGLFGARARAPAQVKDRSGLVAQARGGRGAIVEVGKGNGTDNVIGGFWVGLWG